MQVYQELAVLMADHPILHALETVVQQKAARALLLDVADKTAAVNMMYAGSHGQRACRPLHPLHGSQHGRASRYFERAMQGALGSAHGVQPVSGDRDSTPYAAPAFGPTGAG